MALIPLQKIRIVGFHKHTKTLLKELQHKGMVQINKVPLFASANKPSDSKLKQELMDDYDVARLQSALKFLSTAAPKGGKVGNFLTAGKLLLSEEEMITRHSKVESLVPSILNSCEKISETFVRNKNEIKQQLLLVADLKPFVSLDMRIGESLDTKTTRTVIGKVPLKKVFIFEEKLATTTVLVDTDIFYTDVRMAYVRVTYSKNMQSVMASALNESGFEIVRMEQLFPLFKDNLPATALNVTQQKIERLQGEILEGETTKRKLSLHYENLLIAYECAVWKHDEHQVQDNFLKTQNVFAFEGWIAKGKYTDLASWIRNAFVGDVAVEKMTPNKNEVRPALLKNRPGIAAYQMLTEMFGSPQHDEMDPTPFMAPFFGIFFGICLSDAGYGLFLMLVSVPLLFFGKVSRSFKLGMSTLFVSGLMAFLGGVALGGWFGMTPEQAPSFLINGDGSFIGQIINPLEGSGPLDFLLFSFGIGLVQLIIGTFLYGVKLCYNKKYIDAICDSFLWVYFIIVLVLWGLSEQLGLPKDVLQYMLYAGTAGLVLTGGRKSQNIFAKIGMGLLSLYGIVDYLSATLSYSRLMALGLATGIIGFAMNLTAQVLGDVIPGVAGVIVMVFFILFGHSLNLALSFLGAFVHSMRIHFIEFFGRFYTGGAPLFAPFMRKTKYLFIRQD
jgi:V/A-type H+-transporting ATPase subunit I